MGLTFQQVTGTGEHTSDLQAAEKNLISSEVWTDGGSNCSRIDSPSVWMAALASRHRHA